RLHAKHAVAVGGEEARQVAGAGANVGDHPARGEGARLKKGAHGGGLGRAGRAEGARAAAQARRRSRRRGAAPLRRAVRPRAPPPRCLRNDSSEGEMPYGAGGSKGVGQAGEQSPPLATILKSLSEACSRRRPGGPSVRCVTTFRWPESWLPCRA